MCWNLNWRIEKKNTSCLVFKLRMYLNLHQFSGFLMPVPSYLVIFYWHMGIRYFSKSLFINIQMGDGDGFVPIIWPSLWLLFDLAGLIKSCIWTLADSLMGPIFNNDSMRWLSQFELFVCWSLPSILMFLFIIRVLFHILHLQHWGNLQ